MPAAKKHEQCNIWNLPHLKWLAGNHGWNITQLSFHDHLPLSCGWSQGFPSRCLCNWGWVGGTKCPFWFLKIPPRETPMLKDFSSPQVIKHGNRKSHMGMDQYLLIQFLVGWTSIYQLFWCSPGVQGFDPSPHFNSEIFRKKTWFLGDFPALGLSPSCWCRWCASHPGVPGDGKLLTLTAKR